MEINHIQRLFIDLTNLAKELSYGNELVYFHEFVNFWEFLDANHKDILYEDDSYYYLDDLKENLKEIANNYILISRGVKFNQVKDIPFIDVSISDLLIVLIGTAESNTVSESNLILPNIEGQVRAAVENALIKIIRPSEPEINSIDRAKPSEIALKYEIEAENRSKKSNKKSNKL